MIKEPKEPKQRKGKRVMFREHDIQAIADLVANCKMTEREACITLDFKPEQWNSWKSKHKRSAIFDTLLARTRGLQTKELVSRIASAGLDKEINLPNGKTITKTGDWRANAFILEKTSPAFAPATSAPPPATVSIQIGLVHDQLKRVIGFANPSSSALLPVSSDIVTDGVSDKLESNLNKIKMPMRRAVNP